MGGVFEDRRRPGHWIVYFKGHNYRLDGHKQPIYSQKQAQKMLGYLQTQYDRDPKRFDHQTYGRDKRLIIENAWERYTEESPCGVARRRQRDQLFENYIKPTFGKHSIKDVHFTDLDEWARKIQGRFEASYLKNITSTFRHFFKFWHQREMIDRIPGFPTVTVPRKEILWLTQEQQAQVHEFIPVQHLPIFRFLRDYGRRSSEACNLRRDDIDLAKKQIRVWNSKTNQANWLPLGEEFEKWLVGGDVTAKVDVGKQTTPIRDGHCPPTNLFYIFSTQTGKPYTRQILYDIWHRANVKANEHYGTPIVSNYEGNRKSFASQRMGAYDISLISACMGHANVSTTQNYYGKVETKKLGEVVEIHSQTALKTGSEK